jgi:hypothetical protein
MVGKVNAGLKEGLKERNTGASKALQNEKGDAVTACCFEDVRLFNNTRNLLI